VGHRHDWRRLVSTHGPRGSADDSAEATAVIIFLINNHGYTIEVEIHDGPYNNIKNWDYAGLIQAFNAEDGRGLGMCVLPVVESWPAPSRQPSPITMDQR
jgi:hypothetical protein